MYTLTKKMTVFALALLMLVMSVFVPMKNAEAATMYNNASNASITCTVTSSGQLQVLLNATGIKNKTSRIGVELYVEKRVLGIFWSKIDIGCTDNVWIDSTTGYLYSQSFSTGLPSSGTFRVTVTFTFSGTGGADDIIKRTETVTY